MKNSMETSSAVISDKEGSTMIRAWNPETGPHVPQPAGALCADWYRRANPDNEDLLYALAHTKGLADALKAVYLALPVALTAGKPYTLTQADTQRIVEACHAYKAIKQ